MGDSRPHRTSGTMLQATYTAENGAFLVASAPREAGAAEAAAEAYAQVADALSREGLQVVQERIFASLDAAPAVKAARTAALRARGIPDDGPVNYIQGCPAWGNGFAGAIVRAVPAGSNTRHSEPSGVQTIFECGVARGRTWRAGDATFILLQDVRGVAVAASEDNSPATQARRVIERAGRILRENGANFGHTVRTWFYLHDILGWYGEFNQARNAMYKQYGLLPAPLDRRILPASTGIRATLSGGAACSIDLLAVVAPETQRPVVRALHNPRQEEAFRYGSAFSRAAAIGRPGPKAGETLIELSGTAAIDERGVSLYQGDIRAQVRCTLEKADAVLGQGKASLKDICAATLFVKHAADAQAMWEELAAAGLAELPAVCVEADVCREELLFEIDAEAVVRQ